MPTLTVTLLGEPRLRDAQGVVTCSSKKALGLFCYLAQSGARHSRRELAQLFWGGANVEAARASLRTALLRLPDSLVAGLRVDRDSIACAQGIDVDTTRFAALATANDLPALGEAAALYDGEFLKGLDLDATPEFDDWLARERTRWRQLAQSVFDRLIEGHRERARHDAALASSEREAAMAAARRWCELEPAAEAAHRWLIRLYLETGRPDAALTQYESCRRELAVASGRAPSAQTRALIEALGDGAAAAGTSTEGPARDEPTVVAPGLPSTSFFGRIEELAALEQLLSEPGCRLLTLHAMGGMGKTRLASVLINQVATRFAQGAAWVDLQDITSPTQLPQAVARALGIELPPQTEPVAALCNALRAQHRLLVLDNFEHLMATPASRDGDAVEWVLTVLREAPQVRLLVTSREALGVQEEWIYQLRGLPYPSSDAPASPVGAFAATELFAQRARQAYAGFSAQAEWPHIVRLCAMVEGLPLALELSAAWVRTVPCGDLVAAIESQAKSLASRHRNRPDRHGNLDAVVRTSWNLLQREQQRALAPLSVFVGGFTQEAASAVADAPLRVLSALVDKSLVHRRSDGRLGLHELVRQFLREVLGRDTDPARQAERRHAAWFAELLVRQRSVLDGPHGLDAHIMLTRELPNLMAAAARWEFPAQAEALAEPWLVVLNGRGLQRLALPFADRLLDATSRLHPATRAHLLIQRGVAKIGLGDSAAANVDLSQAVALAREHLLSGVLASALVHQTLVGLLRDDVGFVQACLAELEPLLGELDDPGTVVRAHFYKGMLIETQSRNVEALEHYQNTLVLAGRLGVSQQIQATLQNVVARALIRLGRFDAAEQLLAGAMPVHERAGNQPRLAQALLVRAEALLGLPGSIHAEQAAALAQQALTLHEQSGHPPGISAAAHVRGLALQALGRSDEARRLLERAAGISSPVLKCEAMVDLGSLELAAGSLAKAVPIAIACIDLALEHALASLRWGATLLACEVLLGEHRSTAQAARWLAATLADPDLSFNYRQRALALSAKGSAHSPRDEARPIDRSSLLDMRGELSALGQAG